MKSNSQLINSTNNRLVYRHLYRTKKKNLSVPNTKSPLMRLNTACPYYTMFPLDFPLSHLHEAPKDAWVLDPFCGRGTTLFASRLLGLNCVGIDSNPTATAIAAAKLSNASAQTVIKLAREILAKKKKPNNIPSGEFWTLCFHSRTLNDLCKLREYLLERCVSPEEITLRAILLGILHGPLHKGKPTYLSNQMPRTYSTKPSAAVRFWKRRKLTEPPYVDVIDAVERRTKYTLAKIPPPVKGVVYFGDARHADFLFPKHRKFGWIITSPPYFKMQTYKPDQWLRNWFLGDSDSVNYTQNGQLSHRKDQFVEELSKVWRAVAKRCVPGTRLIVRFGSLPSAAVNARDMLESSLNLSNANWEIYDCKDAGSANNGYRQSLQFGNSNKNASREIDMYARLDV